MRTPIRRQMRRAHPVSLQTKFFQTGDLVGVIYTFPVAGDVLPMHSHGNNDIHITIVARGRVRIYGPNIGSADYAAGAVIDNQAPITHEIIALEDNSRIVNIVKKVKA
jgi:quercetin dioxygenase-like cupin family protein